MNEQVSIENGYFVFTLMPSLYCKLRCPHCYLSLEQRQDKTILSTAEMTEICKKIDYYYSDLRNLQNKEIVCYWYGGEPTSMGRPYFTETASAINGVFDDRSGYSVKHTVLSALVGVRKDWFPIFDKFGKGEIQTSFDGLMRGDSYMKVWDKKVREITKYGLNVSTISVVNHELVKDGPVAVLDYLSDLGVRETSWLPFMLNAQNHETGMYEEYAPKMSVWSDFMIELTEHWLNLREAGKFAPEIGQMHFILKQKEQPLFGNIAGQTLFLLPNGDFVLPDYKDGYLEYMNKFGNILEQDFETVLTSKARRSYLRRQVLKNANDDCVNCDLSNCCVMEFWKPNRENDDCFGGSKYVRWVLANEKRIRAIIGTDESSVMLY